MSDVGVGEVTLGNTPSSTTTCSGHYMPVTQQRPMKAEMCKHFRVGYTINQSSSIQSIKFIISVAHCRLDFTINSRKNTSAMLNVNTTKPHVNVV